MSSKPDIVLARVLRVLQPLVRLLVRQGVTYPALTAALKRMFVSAAQQELQAQGMARTDSAVTLLSGVHRRDVRELTRGSAQRAAAELRPAPLSLAAEVLARWLSDPLFTDPQGGPAPLPRGSTEPHGFDALVAGVSSDVRARAVLEELLRLGVVHEEAGQVHLHSQGFAPQQGFDEMAWLFADNLHDHAAAAAANLQGEGNFLEQAVFVDQLSPASVLQLQAAAQLAWRQAFQTVMHSAQEHFDADAARTPAAQRNQRARFGVYFYSAPMAEAQVPEPATDSATQAAPEPAPEPDHTPQPPTPGTSS
jgi:hypothetical protein